MTKKLLGVLGWTLGLLILALACWLAGVVLGWALWQSVALFLGVIVAGLVLAWLRRRWHAWSLRRRLARPTTATVHNTAQLDADWRAGMSALRQSRLSRFGSPLYVLPWFLALGPDDNARSAMLRRAAAREPVSAGGDEQPALQWWLLPGVVMLDPAATSAPEVIAPTAPGWKRMLHWMMRTRRREPLNGLVLYFSSSWLMESGDAELADVGQVLRQRVDEMVRVYNARVPIYIVLSHCESLKGFSAWAGSLADGAETQAMGYLHKGRFEGVGEFLSDAFAHIVGRMGQLRILQGRHAQPAAEVFGLPERLLALSGRLDKVLRPAFQATPYSETPLLRGLYLTGRRSGVSVHQADWFSEGLLNDVLPSQREAWEPVERLRHWRRMLRHSAVVAWLVLCAVAGAFMVHTAQTAKDQLRFAATDAAKTAVDFSGGLSSDLHALKAVRHAVEFLDARPEWQRAWMPFQHHVNDAEARLQKAYADAFHQEVLLANLNPVLVKVLSEPQAGQADLATVALAQNLVRRINLLEARLADQDLDSLPAPGTELEGLMSVVQKGTLSPLDALLLGDMYRDYLDWQTNTDLLVDERRALQKALSTLGLSARPIQWVHVWTSMQPKLQPMRIADFWDLADYSDLPEVPSAMTLEGRRAVLSFLKELAQASDDPQAWAERQAQYEQLFIDDGLQRWYAFSDAFVYAHDLMADATSRRTVLSSLLTPTDPYRRYMSLLAELAGSLRADVRPVWLEQAQRLDKLARLVQLPDANNQATNVATSKLSTLQSLKVVQDFGGDVIKALPGGQAIKDGITSLSTDQQALGHLQDYQKGVRSTTLLLQQGDGNAMAAAVQIWSYGHDPQVKDVPMVDAYDAMEALKALYSASNDPREVIVWQVAGGAMMFSLDYAARAAACGLQRNWQANVLGAVSGVTDKQLADSLLFGDSGQVNAFLDGDVKHFVTREGVRYAAREALGDTVPFSGQFYGFASQAQLRKASVAGQRLAEQRNQEATAALKEQAQQLDGEIAKLQDIKGSVTLSTQPPLTNAGARLRPESITLTLQCASGPIVLQNMNFANSQVFPWSMSTCADTELVIRYPGFELRQQWGGSRGFYDFLQAFASGQRRYTPADFPAQSQAMRQAGIEWLDVTYRQQGQESIIKAFNEATKLDAQAKEIQAKLDAIHQAAATAPATQAVSGPTALPEQIVMVCMGPTRTASRVLESPAQAEPQAKSTTGKPAAAAAATKKPAAASSKKPEASPPKKPALSSSTAAVKQPTPPKPGTYSVQVGIFSHPEKVRTALQKANYPIQDEAITMRGKDYRNIRVPGYKSREDAAAAAEKISRMLNLKAVVVGEG